VPVGRDIGHQAAPAEETRPSLRILAIDTALDACGACVLTRDATEPVAAESIAMERGHAEALLPLIERVVARLDSGFAALDRVAVTIGPGSYTGLRVGIAAARAIGLAAGVPVVGVTTLSALMAPLVSSERRRVVAAAINARHGQFYLQVVAPGGRTVIPPTLIGLRDAIRLIGTGPVTLTGSGAAAIAVEALTTGIDVLVQDPAGAPEIAWVARLGLAADPAQALPKPLYLRAADAKPQHLARLPRR
jgi:tRNA threonylcarbamoyladenosine biosynthesis protein TsaB